MNFQYITADKDILGGKPIIKNTRLSVEFILDLVASGGSIDEIVMQYPQLNHDAVVEAIQYAGKVVSNEIIINLRNVA